MVSWRAKWKNCFLTTTHGLLPSPSYKTLVPYDAGLVTCYRRLAGQNTCSFVEVIRTFFQSMRRIQDRVHVHGVICPAVRGEGWGRGRQIDEQIRPKKCQYRLDYNNLLTLCEHNHNYIKSLDSATFHK